MKSIYALVILPSCFLTAFGTSPFCGITPSILLLIAAKTPADVLKPSLFLLYYFSATLLNLCVFLFILRFYRFFLGRDSPPSKLVTKSMLRSFSWVNMLRFPKGEPSSNSTHLHHVFLFFEFVRLSPFRVSTLVPTFVFLRAILRINLPPFLAQSLLLPVPLPAAVRAV